MVNGFYRRVFREQVENAAFACKVLWSGPPDAHESQEQRSDAPLFEYTPLRSTLNFRILRLKKVPADAFHDGELPLHGSLVEASIESPPEYYALSYTWGDSGLCETIDMDGRRLCITANCAAALRRLLHGKASRMVWVDSICINQANAPEALVERGHQVAMMDRIYRNAVQVCVYLGPGDAVSDVACAAIKELSRNYLGAILPGPQQQSFRTAYERLADDVLECTPQYPYGKLYGLFCLPWFRRYWVRPQVQLKLNSFGVYFVAADSHRCLGRTRGCS
jgi:hypothetical protein